MVQKKGRGSGWDGRTMENQAIKLSFIVLRKSNIKLRCKEKKEKRAMHKR